MHLLFQNETLYTGKRRVCITASSSKKEDRKRVYMQAGENRLSHQSDRSLREESEIRQERHHLGPALPVLIID